MSIINNLKIGKTYKIGNQKITIIETVTNNLSKVLVNVDGEIGKISITNLKHILKLNKPKIKNTQLMINAKVIADSINEHNRITSMVVTMPRFILAEFNTHRMFSRNSASSRAIPFEKMVKSVQDNPFVPIAWQKNHKGMQGTEYFDNIIAIETCEIDWLTARDKAVAQAIMLSQGGVTKQLCNRLLEPFMYHTVLVTATEWENFFALRCPQYGFTTSNDKGQITYFKSKKDYVKAMLAMGSSKEYLEEVKESYAKKTDLEWLSMNKGQSEIHMMALAEAMWDAYQESTPKQLMSGEWHIPFRDNIDKNEVAATLQSFNNNMFVYNDDTVNQAILEISIAMCARVSYTVVGEKEKLINYKKDMELHDTLVTSGHMSPTEHCAQAMNEHEYYKGINGTVTNYTKTNVKMISSLCNSDSEIFGWSGNFKGFTQYRKLIESNYALRKIYQRNKSV